MQRIDVELSEAEAVAVAGELRRHVAETIVPELIDARHPMKIERATIGYVAVWKLIKLLSPLRKEN